MIYLGKEKHLQKKNIWECACRWLVILLKENEEEFVKMSIAPILIEIVAVEDELVKIFFFTNKKWQWRYNLTTLQILQPEFILTALIKNSNKGNKVAISFLKLQTLEGQDRYEKTFLPKFSHPPIYIYSKKDSMWQKRRIYRNKCSLLCLVYMEGKRIYGEPHKRIATRRYEQMNLFEEGKNQ